MNYVFVYGTLKRGYHNNAHLIESKFIKTTTIKGISLHAGGGWKFPFAMRNPGGKITGEIYEVDNTTLKNLDYLESHPDWYRRKQFNVGKLKVWVYLNPGEAMELPVIKSGVWKG